MVFVLVLCKILHVVPKYSRATFTPNKKFALETPVWGLFNATSPYKNLVNTGKKLTLSGRRFKSPFFLWLMQILKAVAMGVVAVPGTFLAR
jgi:hypothetical protein